MKNVTEWSVEFDLLYNNISSNQAPGLNEYEKSIFLTRAEESVVSRLYNGSTREAFEGSEELTQYLSSLVKDGNGTLDSSTSRYHAVEGSVVFKLPSDVLFKTYERCIVYTDSSHSDEMEIVVIPVTQDDLWRVRRDPFKWECKSRVLRLTYTEAADGTSGPVFNEFAELISKYDVKSYTVRYVAKPAPIILTDLGETGLSINGYTSPMTCMLPEELHQTILVEAVRLAKSVWSTSN